MFAQRFVRVPKSWVLSVFGRRVALAKLILPLFKKILVAPSSRLQVGVPSDQVPKKASLVPFSPTKSM